MELKNIFAPKSTKPEEIRRTRLVNMLLISSAIFALACLFIYIGLTLLDPGAGLEKNLFTVFICTGTLLIAVPLIAVVNHFFTSRISGLLYVFYQTITDNQGAYTGRGRP